MPQKRIDRITDRVTPSSSTVEVITQGVTTLTPCVMRYSTGILLSLRNLAAPLFLINFSSFKASDRDVHSLEKTSVQGLPVAEKKFYHDYVFLTVVQCPGSGQYKIYL